MNTRLYMVALLALMMSFVSARSYAQDVIVKNDLETLKVYNVDVSSNFVYYQESPDAGAPTLKLPVSDVMIIEAGSTILAETWNSCSGGIRQFRQQVMDNKKLSQQSGDLYQLLTDIEIPESFSSPSGAASFCIGTSRQGTKDWKDKEGKMYGSEWWKE